MNLQARSLTYPSHPCPRPADRAHARPVEVSRYRDPVASRLAERAEGVDMSTLTIRLPDTKHERLKAYAWTRGVSVNKLVEELTTVALAQADAENRYLLRRARGKPAVGLRLLDKLDKKGR